MSDSPAKAQPRLKEKLENLCVEMIDRGILFLEAREHFERCFITEILQRYDGNLVRAAGRLGIHRNTLAKRMNHFNKAAGRRQRAAGKKQ
ncbi:MAG TPA: helix-turn-helix domain-containing protein [Acidobacteriota bacterium]|nr:helix-turn-helix domain-containing protein [Acidobacteriota bacterium]